MKMKRKRNKYITLVEDSAHARPYTNSLALPSVIDCPLHYTFQSLAHHYSDPQTKVGVEVSSVRSQTLI